MQGEDVMIFATGLQPVDRISDFATV